MRRNTIIWLLAAAAVAVALAAVVPTADAVPMSKGSVIQFKTVKKQDVLFPGLVECTLALEEPSLVYYKPWKIWYVKTKAYGSCIVWNIAHTIRYPYTMGAIALSLRLWKDDGMIASVIVGDSSKVAYATSMTSTDTSHICGPYDGHTFGYRAVAEAYFVTPTGMSATTDAMTGQIPIGCS